MITEKLIDRLNSHAAQQLVARVRKRRRNALAVISRCCVVTTDDGLETREVIFDQPPTIGQLTERVGSDAWVVSVAMKRTARQRRALAAE
ncbi:MAG: hypothetical protein KUG70_14725 [Rhodobacteraceae bacterium]|nr:hypothetical protein [Paracoccaceae bacterium]